jgi:Arc/MetJ-type ribon-helix-helix transcriptional regulator
LTPQEDDEINDFLSTTLRFKTKSELIRAAVYSYIHKSGYQERQQESEITFSKATMNTLDQMVVKGLFKDRNDALEFIMRKVNEEHFLSIWLSKLVKGYLDTRDLLTMDDFSSMDEKDDKQRGESNGPKL